MQDVTHFVLNLFAICETFTTLCLLFMIFPIFVLGDIQGKKKKKIIKIFAFYNSVLTLNLALLKILLIPVNDFVLELSFYNFCLN